MSALMQQLEVLDTSWQGAAGTTFMSVKANIDAHTKKIASDLMEVANGIRTTNHSFGNEDADAASMVSNAGAVADGLRGSFR